ncbi:hypothetical protein [Luteimonas sp. 3794]|uniref:hypothetical protein n=1 Tax=Luteimonas sp. 3794 TaxID=2817730 RepID=UPI00285A298F|nr:hypothetical protein [Luteimonas sp. 3794]MDR6992431.1 hypothetical protein [Luteimonas sp. 3794]
MIRRVGWLVCMAGLVGCASAPPIAPLQPPEPSPQGAVGASLIEPAAETRRMAMQRNRRFIHPNLDTPAVMPIYPADQLALRLAPVVVCIDAAIDATGTVAAAAARTDATCEAPAGIEVAGFIDAALAAVRQWTYAPALLCVAPESFDSTDACQADNVIETPTAVRLSYAFRFSQQAGTPEVERIGAP